MGPGGYRFSDYPRLGLPLSIMIVIASIPMLLYVWPVS
jgi:di/tricarboxylate transporter